MTVGRTATAGRLDGRARRRDRQHQRRPAGRPPPTAPTAACGATDHQTAGRGRLDRRWDAPPGTNLLVSHPVPPACREHPSELTRRLALAAVDACRRVAGVDVALKWPNDLLVGEAKLAGILAERNGAGAVVVGMGLNVGWAPEGAARLADAAPDVTPAACSRPCWPRSTRSAPTSTRATATRSTRSGGGCASSCRPASSRARRRTSNPTAASSCVDTCAVTHRLAAGDVVHLRPI